MKKSVKIILIVISSLLIVMIGCAIFALSYYKKGIGPVSKESKDVIVTIESGQTATSVLYTLDEAGLVNDVFCGKVYLKLNKITDIKANSYLLNTNMSLEKMYSIMANPTDEFVVRKTVTVLEGATIPEISEAIAKGIGVETTEVMELLNDREFLNTLIEKYWFLTDEILKEGIRYPLEGYFYPETYLFNNNVTLEQVIYSILDMADEKFSSVKDKIEGTGWSVHEFLTFASIVERESLYDEDRPKIAGVFMNRLEKKMRLQSDITVNYAWDRTGVDVSYSHLEIDSPYNTYKYGGLPIGPISTVSTVTINASLDYEENEYYYFFAKSDGTVIYSKTLEEHNKAAKENKWY